jgi:glycosyltransferase involved in cell wall biosynthesis
MILSVVLITFNEEENLPRTLKSVEGLVRDLGGEIIVVDSGSTDRTVEIAKSFGAKIFIEDWKGFAAQKNSAIEKARGDWVLLLDADEEVSDGLSAELMSFFKRGSAFAREWCGTVKPGKDDSPETVERVMAEEEGASLPSNLVSAGFWIPRKNLFLGRWIKHGGFWPDRKLRLFRKGFGRVEERPVHETVQPQGCGTTGVLSGSLIHHAYPTLSSYIEHMNRYSSLGAEVAGPRGFSFINIYVRGRLTFFYNYFLRLGFLDGREGFLLHLYHSEYVSWKYAKAWELSRKSK